jgi:hypothetical protein
MRRRRLRGGRRLIFGREWLVYLSVGMRYRCCEGKDC